MGMDIETIIKITDLSKEEIQKIEKNNTQFNKKCVNSMDS